MAYPVLSPQEVHRCVARLPRVPLAIWYHSDVVRPRMQYLLFYAPMARRVYGRLSRTIEKQSATAV